MENQIRVLRKEKGISQEDLARRCGVSRQTINAIENNKYDPTLSLAFRLARELGVTVDGLFTPGEEQRTRPAAVSSTFGAFIRGENQRSRASLRHAREVARK